MVIRRLLVLLICGLLGAHAVAQVPMTGAGLSKPTASAGFTGLVDINGTAFVFWSTRGPSGSFSGSVFRICDQSTGLVCADATFASGTLTLPTLGGQACGVITCVVSTIYDTSGSNK